MLKMLASMFFSRSTVGIAVGRPFSRSLLYFSDPTHQCIPGGRCSLQRVSPQYLHLYNACLPQIVHRARVMLSERRSYKLKGYMCPRIRKWLKAYSIRHSCFSSLKCFELPPISMCFSRPSPTPYKRYQGANPFLLLSCGTMSPWLSRLLSYPSLLLKQE